MTYLANRLFLGSSFSNATGDPRRFERAQGEFKKSVPSDGAEASLATIWAPAKVFEMQLKRGQREAVESWFSLHGLYVLGKLHLRSISRTVMERHLPALYRALVSTAKERDELPEAGGDTLEARCRFLGTLGGIDLNGLSSDVIVAGWYDTLGFYPGPNEKAWIEADLGKCYLSGRGLSWDGVLEELLQQEHEVHDHFAQVIDHLVGSNAVIADNDIREQLNDFPKTFNERLALRASRPLKPVTPESWPFDFTKPGSGPDKARELLESYPLQSTATVGGKTKRHYLLVRGLERALPGNEWIAQSISGVPKPEDYRIEPNTRTVSFNVGPRQYSCALQEDEEVLELVAERLTTHVTLDGLENRLLRRDLHCPEGNESRRVVVAPVKPGLASLVAAGLRLTRSGEKWTLSTGQRSVAWVTQPRERQDCPDRQHAYLDIWPSWRSSSWKFYAARSSSREDGAGPTWELVLAGGHSPQATDVSGRGNKEFVSATDPMQPLSTSFAGAVALRGRRGTDLGAVFLELPSFEEGDRGPRNTNVAIDFGTSNTCVAYYSGSGDVESLYLPETSFSTRVLGQRATSDFAFFPEKHGAKPYVPEYFASLLLTPVNWTPKREDGGRETCLKAVIPALRGHEDQLNPNLFAAEGWTLHDRLKWEEAREFREAYLTVLSLLVQAEVFQRFHRRISEWAFTFPLALKDHEGFKDLATRAVRSSFTLAFGRDTPFNESCVTAVAESSAIHRIIDSATPAKFLDIFLDLGAGTTDLAIMVKEKAIVLDSLLVAGNAFFDTWREIRRNQTETARARRPDEERLIEESLNKLFRPIAESSSPRKYFAELSGKVESPDDTPLEAAIRFSLYAGALVPDDYGQRCEEATEFWKQKNNYANFRARGLFRHLIGWGLGQALAATRLPEYKGYSLRLTLSGNGWGLLMFAGLPRRKKALQTEVESILQVLSEASHAGVGEVSARIEAVEILSEDSKRGFVHAKTRVAEGALRILSEGSAKRLEREEAHPFSAVWLPVESINETSLDATVLLPPETRWEKTAILLACAGNKDVALHKIGFKAPLPGRDREMLGGLDAYLLLTDVKTLRGPKLAALDAAVWRNLAGNLVEIAPTERGVGAIWRSPVRVLLEDRLYPSHHVKAIFEDLWAALRGV